MEFHDLIEDVLHHVRIDQVSFGLDYFLQWHGNYQFSVLAEYARIAIGRRYNPGANAKAHIDKAGRVAKPGLRKERGVWVYRSGTPTSASIPDLIACERNRRAQDLVGKRQA
jgi:hypothetical protein